MMPDPEDQDRAGRDDPLRAALKRAYDFERWPGREGAALTAPFLPRYDAVPGLVFEQRHPLTRHVFVDNLTGKGGARAAVWVEQAESIGEARESLLDLLQRAMEPLPRCAEKLGENIGDVCFCGSGGLYWVRANVMVRVENIGAVPLAVGEIAAALDHQIIDAA